ncbi:sensor histidine kinase [Paraflavitalea soli]|nr:HAMP domain-containing sensor histidine kinase [Paraflavitalea soli]
MKRIKTFWELIICTGASGTLRESFTCKGINRLSVAIILFNLIAGPSLFILTGLPATLWGILAIDALMGVVILLNAKRLHQAAGLLFFITLNIATFCFAAILGKDANAQLMIVFLVGLASILYDDKRLRAICVGLSFLCFLALEYTYQHNLLPTLAINEGGRSLIRWSSYFAITVLVGYLFCIYSDLTRDLLNELEAQKEQLEQHLLSKKHFIREAVHEIKSGFNPIEGMVAYLAESDRLKKTTVTADQLIGHIKGGCLSYRRLLANLLEFSKIEFGKKDDPIMEPMEIRSFMQQVVNEFQYAAYAEKTSIVLQIDENVPAMVSCDPIKLRQIANNLIHNAIKFVRTSCHVVVKVELHGVDAWQLTVINDGESFTEEQLKRIFHPYQHVRTGVNLEGNGLGLFITHKLVETLQGNIEVVRAVKDHTVFEVTFPLEQRMAINAKTSARA